MIASNPICIVMVQIRAKTAAGASFIAHPTIVMKTLLNGLAIAITVVATRLGKIRRAAFRRDSGPAEDERPKTMEWPWD